MMLTVWTLCHVLISWLCIINAQEYNGRNTGLIQFPADIDSSVTRINVRYNDITSFDYNAFNKFTHLDYLNIANNPFTELPNLRPVGTTLKTLASSYCQVSVIEPEMFAELIVLEQVAFYNCKLTSFPNVAGPANTLLLLYLGYNQLTSTPCLDKYMALTTLILDDNPISDSCADPCVPYITNFTNVSMRQLENLTVISVPCELTTVPLTCPRNDVSISFSGPEVSMCLCRNMWLKAVDGQRGSVNMANKTCGDATTTDEILKQQCVPGLTTSKNMIAREKQFFCAFPIAQYVTGVSLMDCGGACLETLGCSGYNFRQRTGPMFGDCAIVAPTDSSITDIPDQDSPAWTYWTEE